ncbi:MAG: stage II sporulation protein M, partial [Planctomycetota bacterium]
EWLARGRTPGKAAVGIRVVDQQGMPLRAGAAALRNLLRAADWLPAGYLTGLTCMICDRGFRRLGDLAAGSLVVYRRVTPLPTAPPVTDEAVLRLARSLPRRVAVALPARCIRALAGFVSRRRQFQSARRREMAAHLAPALARYHRLRPPRNPDRFLCAVDLLARRGPVPGGRQDDADTGANAASLVGAHRPHWHELEKLLDRSTPLSGAAATRLAHLHRSACADLALCEAYLLPERTRAYLDDLIARTHHRLYRRRSGSWRRLAHSIFDAAPRMLYGDRCLRVAALAFFGTFLLALVLSRLDPELPERILGAPQLEELHQMYADPPRHRGLSAGAGATGFYIRNNVSIALTCFACGIFLGVGSLLLLVFNGLVIGLMFGHMLGAPDPLPAHFLEFVTAHAAFELGGITLCGAAGLRLGWGMVAGSSLPTGQALRCSAAQAVPIIAVGALLVALAAPIEAFISPADLPVTIKRTVGIGSAVLLFAYLGLGAVGRHGQDRLREDG